MKVLHQPAELPFSRTLKGLSAGDPFRIPHRSGTYLRMTLRSGTYLRTALDPHLVNKSISIIDIATGDVFYKNEDTVVIPVNAYVVVKGDL